MSTLMERARSFPRGVEVIANWLGDGGLAVESELAQRRAGICIKCPSNQPGSKLTEAISTAIRHHINVKNGLGIRVSGEHQLQECQICLCQLRLKVHVPIEIVKRHMIQGEAERFKEANPECWQINEA